MYLSGLQEDNTLLKKCFSLLTDDCVMSKAETTFITVINTLIHSTDQLIKFWFLTKKFNNSLVVMF